MGKGTGRGAEGKERAGEKWVAAGPGSRLELPVLPLYSATGAGGRARTAGVYMGLSPPAPREALGVWEEGPARLSPPLRWPPPPTTASRLARAPGDVRRTVGSPRTKEMLIPRQDWG